MKFVLINQKGRKDMENFNRESFTKSETWKLIKKLPGKSCRTGEALWLPVWMHAMDTAGIMENLLREWLPSNIHAVLSAGMTEDLFANTCKFAALVHDLGKFTPAFADLIADSIDECRTSLEAIGLSPKSNGKDRFIHAFGSAAILYQRQCPESLAIIAASHHGIPPNDLEFDSCSIEFSGNFKRNCQEIEIDSPWIRIHDQWIEFSLKESNFSSITEIPELNDAAQILITGLLIMADWIASNPEYCPLIPIEETGDFSLYPQRTEKAWNKVGLTVPWNSKRPAMDSAQFRDVFQFVPNPVQTAVLEAVEKGNGSGIYILEAPMGCGKTEAALAAAEVLNTKIGSGGVFFGLPTQATANGIFERLEPWAEQRSNDANTVNSIRLAHGMAELNDLYQDLFNRTKSNAEIDDEDKGLIVSQWFSGRKQALLANFVVGTVDQLLMATLQRRHFMLRHLGLAGKVVILDECHAYDAHMNCYLDRALEWLGKYQTPVIILSATLPSARRTALIKAYLKKQINSSEPGWETSQAYPLLTWTENGNIHQKTIPLNENPREVTIKKIQGDDPLSFLKAKMKNGGCAGIIVNTVKRAQELYNICKNEFPESEDYTVLLYHSRFLAPDRSRREAELIKRIGKRSVPETRNKVIVIGTQVLEQSLDIDFDVMMTDLCPMDLLLQRIGRLHRHERRRPENLQNAVCAVMGMGDELSKNSKVIYDEYLLLQTKANLPDKILLPTDISPLVQKTYTEVNAETELKEELRAPYQAYIINIKKQKKKGNDYCIPSPKSKKIRKQDIVGFIGHEKLGDEIKAEASVREGDQSVEILLLQKNENDEAVILSGDHKGEKIPLDWIPDHQMGRAIASQRIRLPFIFTKKIDQTIAELEVETNSNVIQWQQSPWIKGKLVLLLDTKKQANLCGHTLEYRPDMGLYEIGKEG